MKIAVAYYSQTGNTERVALAIAKRLGSIVDIVNLALFDQVDLSSYDFLFLGMPIHGSDIPEKLRPAEFWQGADGLSTALFFTHGAKENDLEVIHFPVKAEKSLEAFGLDLCFLWNCRGENLRTDIVSWFKFHKPEIYREILSAAGRPDDNDLVQAAEWSYKILTAFQRRCG